MPELKRQRADDCSGDARTRYCPVRQPRAGLQGRENSQRRPSAQSAPCVRSTEGPANARRLKIGIINGRSFTTFLLDCTANKWYYTASKRGTACAGEVFENLANGN